MDVELLSVKWNNRLATFSHVIGGLRNKASYTDVTLACGGKFYPVHKLVLATCSEYFNDIFEITSSSNLVVILKDIQCSDLEYLLDYMYIGEVNVRQEELSSIIEAAKSLKIKGFAVSYKEPKKSNISGNSPPLKRMRTGEHKKTDYRDRSTPQSSKDLGGPVQQIQFEKDGEAGVMGVDVGGNRFMGSHGVVGGYDDQDDDIAAVTLYLTNKEYPICVNQNKKNAIRKKARNYEIDNGILYYNHSYRSPQSYNLRRVITIPDEKKSIIQSIHLIGTDEHFDLKNTLLHVRTCFYWKGITKDVENYVKACGFCQRAGES